MTQNNLITIVTMWNKVNELSRENLSQQQIVIKLGIHRDTVRRYQMMMSESEFNEHLHKEARRHPCKLDPYRDFIVDQLVAAPFLSSAQVLDHLKEHFPDLPSVSERTVYNVARRIRKEEDIAKEAEPGRSFSHVEDGDWGHCRPTTSKILVNENVRNSLIVTQTKKNSPESCIIPQITPKFERLIHLSPLQSTNNLHEILYHVLGVLH